VVTRSKKLKVINIIIVVDVIVVVVVVVVVTVSLVMPIMKMLKSGICLFVCFPGVTTHCGCIFHSPVAGFSLLVFRGFLITHSDAPQSVGLLWTSDQSVAETST
jgi:hypothetical protein